MFKKERERERKHGTVGLMDPRVVDHSGSRTSRFVVRRGRGTGKVDLEAYVFTNHYRGNSSLHDRCFDYPCNAFATPCVLDQRPFSGYSPTEFCLPTFMRSIPFYYFHD